MSEADREREREEDAKLMAAGYLPAPAPPPSPPPVAASAVEPPRTTPVLLRRGRLRHGNPSGDFLAAPRCGACTRAGHPCRQPAMASGRCRLHGGKSTGPRTAAGLARSRAARLTHGLRTAEVIELRAAAVAAGRRLRALIAGAPLAGHGVHRPVFRSPLEGRSACGSLGRQERAARGPEDGTRARRAA